MSCSSCLLPSHLLFFLLPSDFLSSSPSSQTCVGRLSSTHRINHLEVFAFSAPLWSYSLPRGQFTCEWLSEKPPYNMKNGTWAFPKPSLPLTNSVKSSCDTRLLSPVSHHSIQMAHCGLLPPGNICGQFSPTGRPTKPLFLIRTSLKEPLHWGFGHLEAQMKQTRTQLHI